MTLVVNTALFHTIMSNSMDLTSVTIALIIGLKRAAHASSENCNVTGVGRTSVKKYACRFREGCSDQLPQKKPSSGRPRKISKRATNILKRTVESTVTITARKLKQDNLGAFQEVSVRTI